MISSKAKPKSKAVAKTVLYISFILLVASCNECPTEPEYDIYLSLEEVLSTSVMIKVTLPDSGQINHFELERNDSTIATYSCLDDDTLITDNELIPDTKYTYQVRFLKDDKTKAQSEAITIHTLATTSHDFVWEIDTLGIYGSYLKDAWIVDEDDIWVVGNIVMPDPDSSWNGTGRETFNAAHWNGKEWELMRLCPQNSYYEAQGIWVFSDDDILITSNGTINHYNGKNVKRLWTIGDWQNGSIGNIWASSPDNIYFVGRKGSIVHYDGSNFKKMESGTDVNLFDIDGTPDGKYVYAVGYNIKVPSKSIALEIVNSEVNQLYYTEGLYQEGTYGYVGSVSVKDHYVYFSTPAGIWKYDFTNERSEIMDKVKDFECGSLFVIDHNDIIGYGGGMGYIHYNGETWIERTRLGHHIFSHNGGDYKNGLAVIVGYTTFDWKAIIARGHR